MNRFCKLLNENPARFGLKPACFQDILIIFAYRLLQFSSLEVESTGEGFDHAVHVTLLCFVTTLMFEKGRMHLRGYELLNSTLRNAVSELMVSMTLQQQPTLLWILFTGGISVYNTADGSWLHPYIRSCLSSLDITTWDEARAVFTNLPWVGVAHDAAGRNLWQKINAEDNLVTPCLEMFVRDSKSCFGRPQRYVH